MVSSYVTTCNLDPNNRTIETLSIATMYIYVYIYTIYLTRRLNTQRYYTPKCLISYILFNCFFLYCLSAHYSLGGKRKRLEKRSARSRLVKQVFFFLQYKIINFPYNRAISQDICTLFARYLYSTLCSWIIKNYT